MLNQTRRQKQNMITSYLFTGCAEIFLICALLVTSTLIGRLWVVVRAKKVQLNKDTNNKSPSMLTCKSYLLTKLKYLGTKLNKPIYLSSRHQLKKGLTWVKNVGKIWSSSKQSSNMTMTNSSERWFTTQIIACKRLGLKRLFRRNGTLIELTGRLTLNWMRRWSGG